MWLREFLRPSRTFDDIVTRQMIRNYVSRSEEETARIGREIAHLLPLDAIVHLVGSLGSGKTTLVRSIATELGSSAEEVTSPTFAIIQEYMTTSGSPIVHVDAYRLSDDPHEWLQIGIPELLKADGLKLIEWPKKGFRRFGEPGVEITIGVGDSDERLIAFMLHE